MVTNLIFNSQINNNISSGKFTIFINPYLHNQRMIHNTSVLFASNSNITGGILGKFKGNPILDLPLNSEGEKILFSNLNTLRDQSQQMNGFEYMKSIQSNFEDSIPMIHKKKYTEYLESRNLNEIAGTAVEHLKNEAGTSSGMFKKLSSMNGRNLYDKWCDFLNRSVDTNSNESELTTLAESLNNEYKKVSPNLDSGNLVEILPDGKILIDGPKCIEFFLNMKNTFLENLNKMDLDQINIFVYSLSTLTAYRGIVWAYDKGNNLDLSVFMDDKNKLEALNIIQKYRFKFTTQGALGVLLGMYAIYFVNKTYLAKNVVINVSSTTSSNNPQKSLIFLVSFFKNLNIFVKMFIIFVFIPITFYFSLPYLAYIYMIYINFLNNNILKLKLFFCLINVLILLHSVTELYLINIFSSYSEKPTLHKYIPSFISKKIFSLYCISKFNKEEKLLLIGYMLKSLIYFLLLFVFFLTIFIVF